MPPTSAAIVSERSTYMVLMVIKRVLTHIHASVARHPCFCRSDKDIRLEQEVCHLVNRKTVQDRMSNKPDEGFSFVPSFLLGRDLALSRADLRKFFFHSFLRLDGIFFPFFEKAFFSHVFCVRLLCWFKVPNPQFC